MKIFPKFLKQKGFEYLCTINGVRYFQLMVLGSGPALVHGFPIPARGFCLGAINVAKK